MDKKMMDWYTKFKMRYIIDRNLAERGEKANERVIYHRGKKNLIETRQVEFHIDEIDFIKIFLEIVGETKGITEVWVGDINLTAAYEYMKEK